tara:strand:+ start:511 stop:774 length:264 start_codon:yes stop_codon:yes gene_type:complete
MKIAVWDTYVERQNGSRMHFDILVCEEMRDEKRIYGYGKQYLDSKPFKTEAFNSKRCNFCHIESATPEIEAAVRDKGFYILEMENCA